MESQPPVKTQAKIPHRPPALDLEEHDQPFPPLDDPLKARQGMFPLPEPYCPYLALGTGVGMLQRLQELLPSSRTAGAAHIPRTDSVDSTHNSSSKPEQLRKQRGSRSASLPSVRWDMSPLKRNPTKTPTLDESLLSAATTTGTTHTVKGLKIRMITWNMHDSLPKVSCALVPHDDLH